MDLGEGETLSRIEKLLRRILSGRSDSSIRFGELRTLLLHLGFTERTRGSHHLFHHPELGVRVNLQPQGGKAERTKSDRFELSFKEDLRGILQSLFGDEL